MKEVYALYIDGELKTAKETTFENLELLKKEADMQSENADWVEVRMVFLIKSEDQAFGDFDGYYESGAGYELIYDPAGPMETAKRKGWVPVPHIKDVLGFIREMEQEGYACWIESAYSRSDILYVEKETRVADNETTLTTITEKSKLINHVAKEIIKDVITSIREEPIRTGYLEWGDGRGSISLEAYRTYGGKLPIPFNYFDNTHTHWETKIDGEDWHAKVFFSHDGERSIISAVFVDDPDGDGYLVVDVLDSPVFTNKYDDEDDDDVWVYSDTPYYKESGNYLIRL